MGKRLSALGVRDVTLVILQGRKSIARIRPFLGKLPAASFLLYVGRKSSSAPNERRTPERATSAMQSPPEKPNQHPSHSKPRVRLTPRVRFADETRSVRLRTRKPGRQPGLPVRSRAVPRAVSSIRRNALNIIAERRRCEGLKSRMPARLHGLVRYKPCQAGRSTLSRRFHRAVLFGRGLHSIQFASSVSCCNGGLLPCAIGRSEVRL